jgi:hypothetical protein
MSTCIKSFSFNTSIIFESWLFNSWSGLLNQNGNTSCLLILFYGLLEGNRYLQSSCDASTPIQNMTHCQKIVSNGGKDFLHWYY